ncbi:MAG TPA: hypothetical protein VED63_03555 [Acidimicrobiales bacterium]|nr:hypothetical protein [Acidimicrobiales bacterium]
MIEPPDQAQHGGHEGDDAEDDEEISHQMMMPERRVKASRKVEARA